MKSLGAISDWGAGILLMDMEYTVTFKGHEQKSIVPFLKRAYILTCIPLLMYYLGKADIFVRRSGKTTSREQNRQTGYHHTYANFVKRNETAHLNLQPLNDRLQMLLSVKWLKYWKNLDS